MKSHDADFVVVLCCVVVVVLVLVLLCCFCVVFVLCCRLCVRINCDFKSHQSQKVILVPGRLYMMGGRKDQALLEPSLDVSALPKETDPAVLITTQQHSNVWKAFFVATMERKEQAPSSEVGSDASWEDLESPSLDHLSAVTSSYVTHKKLKVGFLLEAFADSIPIGLGKAEPISKLPDITELKDDPLKQAQADALRTIIAEWNILKANFETFNDEFTKLGEGEKKYRDAISETVMKIHDAIRDTDARTSLMNAQIGHDKSDASNLGTDSVCNSVRRMYDTTKLIQEQVDKATLETATITQVGRTLTGKMEILDNFLMA
jgi:hypothetical protein